MNVEKSCVHNCFGLQVGIYLYDCGEEKETCTKIQNVLKCCS